MPLALPVGVHNPCLLLGRQTPWYSPPREDTLNKPKTPPPTTTKTLHHRHTP